MTGHQSHPGLERNAIGEPVEPLDIAKLAEACGVKHVRVIDPLEHQRAVAAARRPWTMREFPLWL
ncbi:hypothetical protein N752_10035 [Desulforamulus aquiferis]|nr:hypothetical protein N752_10035 [Desulforamulus aquiferis]